MVGWHYRHKGHESEQAPANGEGQENLACCSPCGCKESRTQLSNWTEQITESFSLPQVFTLRSPVLRKYCVLLYLVFGYDWGLQLEERAAFYSYLSQYNMEQRQHKVGAWRRGDRQYHKPLGIHGNLRVDFGRADGDLQKCSNQGAPPTTAASAPGPVVSHPDPRFHGRPSSTSRWRALRHSSKLLVVYGIMADAINKFFASDLHDPSRNHLDPERCSWLFIAHAILSDSLHFKLPLNHRRQLLFNQHSMPIL